MKASKQTLSTKTTRKMTLVSLLIAVSLTGCSSTNSSSIGSRILQSTILGAASGAATQIKGNSDDVKNAAAVGALLGILGGVVR